MTQLSIPCTAQDRPSPTGSQQRIPTPSSASVAVRVKLPGRRLHLRRHRPCPHTTTQGTWDMDGHGGSWKTTGCKLHVTHSYGHWLWGHSAEADPDPHHLWISSLRWLQPQPSAAPMESSQHRNADAQPMKNPTLCKPRTPWANPGRVLDSFIFGEMPTPDE